MGPVEDREGEGPPGRSIDTAFLRSVQVFSGLSEEALSDLVATLEPVDLVAGRTLLTQGADADALYVIVTGRLRVSVATGDEEQILHELSRGQVFGEIALLTGRPRTATIRSVRDSYLLRLPARDFHRLIDQHPRLLLAVSRLLVDRLLRVDREQRDLETVRTIALLPIGDRDVFERACEELHVAFSRLGKTISLTSTSVDAALGHGASRAGPGEPMGNELVEWLHRIEADHRFVLYRSDPAVSGWSRWCVREADQIALVADDHHDGQLDPLEEALLGEPLDDIAARRDLVVIHRPAALRPVDTMRWLKLRTLSGHHHLREGSSADYRRLARMLSGNGVGIVLGGGGARGFAHLGVLKALEDAGIPLDVVGGTSIGAVMGAFFALGLDHDARVELVMDGFVRNGFLFDFTLPLVSLSSSRKIERLLRDDRFMTGTPIEDLWRGYFCLASNLTRAEVVIHRRGELGRAIRSSFSLPGVFPPVCHDGDLLVDGGVMNNLPVDVMRSILGGGTLIAVDLRRDVDLRVEEPFATDLSGWSIVRDAIRMRSAAMAMPNILEVLMRTMELGSTRAQRDALAEAEIDLYVRPPVVGLGLLEFKNAHRLIDVAYRAAMEDITAARERLPAGV